MTTKFQIFGIEVVEAWAASAWATATGIHATFHCGEGGNAGNVSLDLTDEAARKLMLGLQEGLARRGDK